MNESKSVFDAPEKKREIVTSLLLSAALAAIGLATSRGMYGFVGSVVLVASLIRMTDFHGGVLARVPKDE
jgi:hypothetical protein